MKFKIEDNIPLPSMGGRGPRVDYPFLQMTVGQSIFVPGVNVKKMSGQVSNWKKNHGMNFAIRAVTEDVLDEDTGETVATAGVRVWVKDPEEKSNRGRKSAAATAAAAAAATDTAPDATDTTDTTDATDTTGDADPAKAETAPKKGRGKKSEAVTDESEY